MHAHEHAHDLGGDIVKGFEAAVVIIISAVLVVLAVLLARYLVRRLSPRLLCAGCNRYYSARRAACPLCGQHGEAV